jgi:hypothetical protein
LIARVEAAHNFKKGGVPHPMRIILDVVINHSGDNWFYKDGPKNYSNGTQFDFGDFRRADRPIPTELRNKDWYHRRGQISNFDMSPENQLGDIVTLKDYANDDDAVGSAVVNALIKAHAYWIRQADVDGFRVDAVKHMGPLACSRFCSSIREYAYSLGKRGTLRGLLSGCHERLRRLAFLDRCRLLRDRAVHRLTAWHLECVRYDPHHDLVPLSRLEGCPQMHQATDGGFLSKRTQAP